MAMLRHKVQVYSNAETAGIEKEEDELRCRVPGCTKKYKTIGWLKRHSQETAVNEDTEHEDNKKRKSKKVDKVDTEENGNYKCPYKDRKKKLRPGKEL